MKLSEKLIIVFFASGICANACAMNRKMETNESSLSPRANVVLKVATLAGVGYWLYRSLTQNSGPQDINFFLKPGVIVPAIVAHCTIPSLYNDTKNLFNVENRSTLDNTMRKAGRLCAAAHSGAWMCVFAAAFQNPSMMRKSQNLTVNLAMPGLMFGAAATAYGETHKKIREVLH